MCFIKWAENLVGKMKWWDFSLIKGATFFATLFLIVAWPAFHDLVMSFDWYWYLILAFAFGAPVLKKMF